MKISFSDPDYYLFKLNATGLTIHTKSELLVNYFIVLWLWVNSLAEATNHFTHTHRERERERERV